MKYVYDFNYYKSINEQAPGPIKASEGDLQLKQCAVIPIPKNIVDSIYLKSVVVLNDNFNRQFDGLSHRFNNLAQEQEFNVVGKQILSDYISFIISYKEKIRPILLEFYKSSYYAYCLNSPAPNGSVLSKKITDLLVIGAIQKWNDSFVLRNSARALVDAKNAPRIIRNITKLSDEYLEMITWIFEGPMMLGIEQIDNWITAHSKDKTNPPCSKFLITKDTHTNPVTPYVPKQTYKTYNTYTGDLTAYITPYITNITKIVNDLA